MQRSIRSFVSAAMRLSLCAGMLLPVAPIAAQQVMFSTSVNLGGDFGEPGGGAQISTRSLDRYAKVLALSPDQADAAKALLEGYLSESRAAAKAAQSAMESAFAAYQDSQDNKALQEATGAAQKKHSERAAALEKGYFGDLRQLLTPDQEDRWPRLERLRRREKGLNQGALSGEAVDLTQVIDDLKLDPAVTASLAEAVEQYESDMDRAIQARDAATADAAPQNDGPNMVFDITAMQAAMAKAREAGAQVRDVNQTNERKIEVLLPESQRAPFALAFKRRCFPEVYRTTAAARSIGAAAKFSDLTGEQKSALDDLRQGYEREAAPANDAWTQAIVASEASGSDGAMSMGGGSVMRIQFGDDSGPLADARKARKAIDDKARDRLNAVLTPAQRERLPTEQDAQEDAVAGNAVTIRSGG